MPKPKDQLFETLTTEGALLPTDFLQRLAQRDQEIPGLTPDAYHLGSGERINEAISRSWNRLLAIWKNFAAAIADLPASDSGTTLSREKWLLPLFQEFGYGRLSSAKPVEFEGRRYAISHAWQNTPIHLVSFRADLDTRSENIIGARTTTPHSMVQEFLNRSQGHVWGAVSNGYRLRLLRDNVSLTRQAFVEFDLQSMMQGEVYADFALLWLLLHQSRVEGERPELCWLEKWTQEARQRGARALDQLRDGVEEAITALGSGFLSHPSNTSLREKLNSGALTKQDYFRQLLRVVYRFLFLFVAEDRELLFAENVPVKTRQQYLQHYSLSRLRRIALRLGGTQHADLWDAVLLVFKFLGSDKGCRELGLPALGSFLWSEKATAGLNNAQLANRHLLHAIRALAFAEHNKVRRPIDYKNIGTEELGSVYESLLEQHPDVHVPTAKFTLGTDAGHERKTTGSYYTPPSLVQSLLDSALEPVLAEARTKENPEEAILSLKVCDPACGSGHFLIAAAHRIARRLATVRTGEHEPAPAALRHALRDVIGRCIYGVDINPMAVELCKFALWLEAVEPGKPLSFLDHHIQCGNSLIGATPALMQKGIPDSAFEPIEGDEKKYCAQFKKANKEEAKQMQLFATDNRPWEHLGNLAVNVAQLVNLPDDTLADVQTKERRYAELVRSGIYESGRQLADAWCAAFVWKKRKQSSCEAKDGFDYPITNDIFRRLERNPRDCPPWMRKEIRRLAEEYQFFHWHLAFPDVFTVPAPGSRPDNTLCGWNGGFDVLVGNPPWEHTELKEKEWFAERRPDIANAANDAARKRLIEALRSSEPTLHARFSEAVREADGKSHLLRDTGLYPLCGRGRINLYPIFAESMRSHLSKTGRLGCVLPSGIATDDTTKFFFQDVVQKRSLFSLFDFENRNAIFPGVHRSYKFCLFTIGSGAQPSSESAVFVFFAHKMEDIREPERRFALSPDDIALLNPNTRTCPVFRSRRDADLTKALYGRVPVLVRDAPEENPWGVVFKQGWFNMATDSELFRTRQQLELDGWQLEGNTFCRGTNAYLPLYEAKMTNLFDHRHGNIVGSEDMSELSGIPAEPTTLAQHQDATFQALPRYWVPEEAVQQATKQADWQRGFFVNFRDVARATDVRTAIHAVIPYAGVGHKAPLILPFAAKPGEVSCLLGNLNAYALDFVVRQKIGGASLSFFIMKQLPVLSPRVHAQPTNWTGQQLLKDWLLPRVLELTYTAWDLEAFAQDCGWSGPPFRWDDERRFLLRCELDAAFFHLYGLTREDAAYIMDTFPIVRRKDEDKNNGDYRTKRVILEIYDEMKAAMDCQQMYQSRLNPPPADVKLTHDPRLPGEVRPALAPLVYFQIFIPLLLRFQRDGIERSRLLHALELLTESSSRQSAVSRMTSEVWKTWSRDFPRGFSFSDAAGVLIALLRDGTVQGVDRCRLADATTVNDESAWLRLDAFAALRLAMNASIETIAQTENKRAETITLMLKAAA